ncbi:MAG TPA: Calx-beta domain-containing protein [Pyrinomonadaceae bacterium]
MTKSSIPAPCFKFTAILICILSVWIGWLLPSASSSVVSPSYSVAITGYGQRSNSVVYHAPSSRIYSSIPSGIETTGNSVSRMNPEDGSIEQSVWVGSEPEKLVLTADGSSLYVKLRGARAIRKVDVTSMTAGLQFDAGLTYMDGPLQVVDFAVSPTNPNLVALSRDSESISGPRGVAVYDNGVQRATTGGTSGALAFSESDSLVYGNSYYGGDLEKITLTAGGVSGVTATPGAGGSRLRLVDGRLYTSYGKVLDPATGNLLGTFTFGDLPYERIFFVDSISHKVFFVARTYQGIEVRAYDTKTFVPVGVVTLLGVDGTPKDVTRWGTNGLAISTPDAYTYFIRSDLVGPGEIGSPAPTPTPVPVPYSPAFVRRVDIPNNYIAYNELDQKIYASVPSSGGPGLGNTVTRIDPLNGSTVSSVFIGSEPRHLALSGDGTALYVALSGAQAVRRFDTVTQTAGLQFTATPGNYMSDIAVSPGDPGTVVVASGGAVGVYDNGVKRPTVPNAGVSFVEYNSTPDVVYAVNGTSSAANFYKLGITPTGMTVLSDVQRVFNIAREVRFAGGRMYGSDGRVVDPETNRILGRFSVTGDVAGGNSVVVDPDSGRAFVLSRDELAAFDINTFNKIGAIPNPATSTASYEPATLVRWGANGLAFRNRTSANTPTDQIYLIQTYLVSTSGTVPTGYYLGASSMTVGDAWVDADIVINRTGDISVPGSVDYATASGTATPGADYVAVSGTATFAPGEASKIISVPLIDDDVYEGPETFSFTLSNPTGSVPEIMNPGSTTVTINDNEGEPSIYPEYVGITEPPLGLSTPAYIGVHLSNASALTVTVDFSTVNATALAGSDYVPTSGTLTFNPLETVKSVPVQILGDSTAENEEHFFLSFSNATNSNVPYPQVPVSIRNLNNAARVLDFDGDNKTDIGIFRPVVGEWWIRLSGNTPNIVAQFGSSTDRIVPADYTGDGKCDIAFWRPETGEWYVLRSENYSFYSVPFGTNGDIPAPADYDADGKADTAVFRPSDATWYISRSTGGTTIAQFGANGDQPVAADYDSDGKADLAIYRPSNGQWWLNRSTGGVIVYQFGNDTDKAVQGDYTGDGKADVAFWRPATGEWFILRSEDTSYYSAPFGSSGDIPAPGDYDGDGKFDTTVFRPSSATWYVQRTTGGTIIQQFGANGDQPVASAFVR